MRRSLLPPSVAGLLACVAVLSGRATFTIEGEALAAPAGSLVFVKDPAARRSAVADEAATEILVVGAVVAKELYGADCPVVLLDPTRYEQVAAWASATVEPDGSLSGA